MRNFKSALLCVLVLMVTAVAASHAARTEGIRDIYNADGPFLELTDITPSDTTVYAPPLRGCIVQVEGDLALLPFLNDTPVTINNVVVGQLVPVIAKKIMANGTTATVACGR